MTAPRPISDEELHAYVDGEVDPARAAEIETSLAADAELSARAVFYGRVNADLHRCFDPVLARDALAPARLAGQVGQVSPVYAQAAIAHAVYTVEVRHPVEVAANEEAHLTRWLSNRMGREIKAPRLDDRGYRLMGGRLLPTSEGGVACQFMYENAAGNRITLFMKSAPASQTETAFRFVTERNGLGLFYWIDNRLAYAVAGTLSRDELLRLSHQVYDQLT
ncbi:MAG: anti-sigma factor [Rhodospirillales bacterium]|nr:anti-sigma factor [Rhodospirillales bacterium]